MMKPQVCMIAKDALRKRVWKVGMCLLWMTQGVAWSQDTGSDDPVERQMYFIDQASEATSLLTRNKTEEALRLFQYLAEHYSDVDEDGYAAIAVGDCLDTLGRTEEAWTAYEAALVAYPEQEENIQQKMIELELSDSVSNELVVELRDIARHKGQNWRGASVKLGRALQKQAKQLLSEAAVRFRAATEEDMYMRFLPSVHMLKEQASMLEELVEDLASVIGRYEDMWKLVRQGRFSPRCGLPQDAFDSELTTEAARSEWTVQTKDDQHVRFEMKKETGATCTQIKANGRSLVLTETQKLLIRRHHERINAILVEAVEKMQPSDRTEP